MSGAAHQQRIPGLTHHPPRTRPISLNTATPFWTAQDYLERSRSPDPRVRAWAMARLERQHPLQAIERAVQALGDEDENTSYRAFELLHRWGDASLARDVLAGVETAAGDELSRRARLLGEWGCEEASQTLLARMNERALHVGEFEGLCQYFVRHEPAQLGTWARQQLELGRLGTLGQQVLVDAIAECHIPGDLAWLVDHWIERSRELNDAWRIMDTLRRAIGPSWLAGDLPHRFAEGAAAVAARIHEQEQVRLPLSEPDLKEALRSARAGQGTWVDTVLAAAHTVVEQRQLPVETWRQADERPVGFRWQVLATLALLEHLAAIQDSLASLPPQQHGDLLALALAGLAGMLADQDDRTWLDERVADRREALLELLASPRQRVDPRVVRELAELGPSILPALREQLVQGDRYWARVRAAQCIKRIAAQHPEPCLELAGALLDAVEEDDGDYLHPPALGALRLLGPPAAAVVQARLEQTGDELGTLSDLLACYPIPRSAEVLHRHLLEEPHGPRELLQAIVALGCEDSIDFLIEQGFADIEDPGVAQALLDLCAIHDRSHPAADRWRVLVDQAEAQRKERMQRLWGRMQAAAGPGALARGGSSDRGGPEQEEQRAAKRKQRKAERQQQKKARRKKRKKKR